MRNVRKCRVFAVGCIVATIAGMGTWCILHNDTRLIDNGSVEAETAVNTDIATTESYTSTEFTSATSTTIASTEASTTEANVNVKGCDVYLTEDEIYTLATLVYLEAGIEPLNCQKDVASVVLNRMMIYDESLEDVIYKDGQFSPAYMIEYTKPTETSLAAVNYVIENGTTIPDYVTYFRSGGYHRWGDLIGYVHYTNTYFSYSESIKDEYESNLS